ncbi:MAG: radical SAM protein [Bacteroidaceae bacterium]|nr:radical SAM protein [Bacteroidaceae bacterium]
MKIGLIDVDGHNFPNLPLMKLSAWHKKNGDSVEFYTPLLTGHCDRVYMSKVFTFTEDYNYFIDADEIIKGGTGYYYPDGGAALPEEIEHIYPDYDLYNIKNTAYGFLTRGCPRGCSFCIVEKKEGRKSIKVANLSEFWKDQKNIELLDPNFFACSQWEELAQQLIASKANINFNQGCDIRIMTKEKINAIKQMKIKTVHFAWDQYSDKEQIIKKFELFKNETGWDKRKTPVYVLCGYNTTLAQDIERIETLKSLNYWPYVMLYNKDKIPRGHDLRKLQRWVNNRFIFEKVKTFDEYKNNKM